MARSILPRDGDPTDAAIGWIVRLTADEQPTDAELAAFWRWIGEHPRHRELFAEQAGRWHAFADLGSQVRSTELTWLASFVERQFQKQKWRRIGGWSLAASVLIALLAGSWFHWHAPVAAPDIYATKIGESRRVQLSDGSIAQLNTRTRLKWLADRRQRQAILLEGEALFQVAHDVRRPFRVQVDRLAIQALGTQFNVHRKAREVVIVVLEGAVEVRGDGGRTPSDWRKVLHENQRLVYRGMRNGPEIQAVAARDAVQWPQGLLRVDEQPLIEVVDDLARYTVKRILVRDPVLQQVRMTGAINTRDIRQTLILLQENAPFTFAETPDAFVLDYRPRSGATSDSSHRSSH